MALMMMIFFGDNLHIAVVACPACAEGEKEEAGPLARRCGVPHTVPGVINPISRASPEKVLDPLGSCPCAVDLGDPWHCWIAPDRPDRGTSVC